MAAKGKRAEVGESFLPHVDLDAVEAEAKAIEESNPAEALRKRRAAEYVRAKREGREPDFKSIAK